MNRSMNKFINLILFTSLVFCQNQTAQDVLQQIQKRAQDLNKPKNIEIENKFAQAKTLERSGLYEEALLLYKEINRSNPGISKYFLPLKNYLKQTESWDSLMVYTQSFSNARNNDLQSKLEFLDVYILMEAEDKWEPLATALVLDLSLSENSIKNILQRLVNLGKLDFAYDLLTQYRKKTGKQDFYSIELGSYLGMRMAYEKSVREYLLFLEFHPQQLQTISDRIMVFPDDPKINAVLKEVLRESPFKSAQFILADLQFKLKEFDLAFETLIANNANHTMLLDFGKDLSGVKEYMRANKVFTHIINSTKNEQILTKTVFEIVHPNNSALGFSERIQIQSFVHLFEESLFLSDENSLDIFEIIDMNSFVDFLIINEFCKNIDAYRLSTYFQISEEKKLKMGPIWDFNFSFGLTDYLNGYKSSGFVYSSMEEIPFWWEKLNQNKFFNSALTKRWKQLRSSTLSDEVVMEMVEKFDRELEIAQENNFDKWSLLGQKEVWPNYYIGDTHQDEVNYLQRWISERAKWLDKQWKN